MSKERKKESVLDTEKLKHFFNSAVAKLILQSPDSNIEKHSEINKIFDSLKEYSLGEKLVLLSLINAKILREREVKLSEPENLEAISYTIFHSLVQSQIPGNLLFIVGRISERALRLFPELAGALDKEMNKIIAGTPGEPGYIS